MGIVGRRHQHLGMLGARQQLLELLILTRLAGDAAVNFYAAAALGRKATLYGEPLRVVRTVEQARLDARQRLALAHRRRIRALAQNKLEGREQRGLAGAGLAGQNR